LTLYEANWSISRRREETGSNATPPDFLSFDSFDVETLSFVYEIFADFKMAGQIEEAQLSMPAISKPLITSKESKEKKFGVTFFLFLSLVLTSPLEIGYSTSYRDIRVQQSAI
jgi:hypothetical protein